MKRMWFVRRIALGSLAAVGLAGLFGFGAMFLWNALVPDLFHGPVIGFWQAVGLLVLSRILFHGGGKVHRWHDLKHRWWRRRFEERLAAMTPEEREKFKREWGWHSPKFHGCADGESEAAAR